MDRLTDENIIYEYKEKGDLEPFINIKAYNLKIIAESGSIISSELNKKTRIPLITLCDLLIKLIIDKQSTKFSVFTEKRRRPKILYEVKKRQ